VRSLNLYDDFIARVADDSGIAVPYRRTGTLDVATDESELAALRTIASVLHRRAVPSLLLDAASARAEEPLLADGVAGGLLIENHGFVAAAHSWSSKAASGAFGAAAPRCSSTPTADR